MYFLLFRSYLPLEKDVRVKKLEYHLPKDALCQVWLKLAQWFWRSKKILKFHQCIFVISWLSFLGKGQDPSFEQNWIQFTMPGCFVLSLVEIGQAVLEKKILKFVNVFSPFRNYLPFGKDVALDLNKLESPSPKDTLCQVWLKLAQWFWRRRRKCENFTMTTDNGQIVIRKAHLSLWLRWAKKWPPYFFKIMFNIKACGVMVKVIGI